MTQGGFKFFPVQPAKLPGYGKMVAAFFGFYALGHSYVQGQFGDNSYQKYLFRNKSAIISGTKTWEKQDE